MMVAGYCRVSTRKEDQANSYEAQQRHFRKVIANHEGWELYRIYADEGISGTAAENRTAFMCMICDAREGKFDLILTKEISRFSRNVLDTIRYTRELKCYGVGVLFENENINTLHLESELYLSILGSVAQEESRHISNRVKWGQTRQMEQGVVFGRSLLGYEVEQGKLYPEPNGAQLVKLIFYKYGVEKKGTAVIAKELQEAGYRTGTGNPHWSAAHILRILKNEKYAGDLIQKKTYTPNYLTHRKKRNCGQEGKIFLKDHHEPIIGRELWNTVQEELQKRSKTAGTGSVQHLFSGKIRCGECGRWFVSRTRSQSGGSVRYWRCGTAAAEGRSHTDPSGTVHGCNVGRLLRDDAALEMLKLSLRSLPLDWEKTASHIADLAADAVITGTERNRQPRGS